MHCGMTYNHFSNDWMKERAGAVAQVLQLFHVVLITQMCIVGCVGVLIVLLLVGCVLLIQCVCVL